MPIVSVLMPCFNAECTIETALESIALQTMPDYELVIVDDGSTDNTTSILNKWAEQDTRIRVFEQAHSGIIQALNFGLQNCSSDLVARMDADDWMDPERLTLQVDFLHNHPEIGLVSCLVEGFPEESVREGFRIYINWLNSLVDNMQIKRELFIESPIPHPSVLIRKDVIDESGGYQDRGWAEDYDLWLRLSQAGIRFQKIPRVLLKWREHPGRLTRVDSRYSLENFIRAKAHYLSTGPLEDRNSVFIWGAGMTGRRLSKHMLRNQAPLKAFFDIDPKKIGRTKRGLPILGIQDLDEQWNLADSPVLISAVGSRNARQLIRQRLEGIGLREGIDWWCAA